MNLTLKRTYFEDATIGVLSIDGVANPIWHTIEKPWRDNEVKVSCIPEGEYQVVSYSSAKYPDAWELKDVDGRTYILIHPANWESQLQGCIAPGLSACYMKNSKTDSLDKAVSSSRQAMLQIKKATNYPESFKLTITS